MEICKKTRNGFVLIKTKNLNQAKQLVQLIKISPTIIVDVTEHNFLNNSKGVIFTRELFEITEDEILKELKVFNVIEVKKILRKANDNMIQTGLVILTFSTSAPPEDIYVGYERLRIRPFIPNPLRCYNCFKFGHPTKYCKDNKICANCSNSHHLNLDNNEKCTLTTHCVNCYSYKLEDTLHNSLDKKCPIFLREKEIQAIKTLQKVDIQTARKIFSQRFNYSAAYSTPRETTNYRSLSTFSNANQLLEINTNINQTPAIPTPPTKKQQFSNTQPHHSKEQQLASEVQENNNSLSTLQMSPLICDLEPTHQIQHDDEESHSLLKTNDVQMIKENEGETSSLGEDITSTADCKTTNTLNLKSQKNAKILPRKISNRLKRQLKSINSHKSKVLTKCNNENKSINDEFH